MANRCFKQRVWVDGVKIKGIAKDKGGMKGCVENCPGYAYITVKDTLRRTNHITLDMALYLTKALDITLADIIVMR